MTSILFAIVRISSSLFKCNYIKNKKLFIDFLFHLWNLHQILNIFEKKMIVIANVFSKLQTVKNLVKPLSWKRRFRTSFNSHQVNGCQALVKSVLEHLFHIFWSLWGETIWKISALFKFEILEVFVNTRLLMTSILLRIVRIWSYLFKCKYLKHIELFLNFLLYLWNLHQILNIFQKKTMVKANLFPKIKTVKTWVDHSLESAVSEHPLAVNMLKGHIHLWNLPECAFIIFSDQSDGKWLRKALPYWTLKS